MMFCILFLSGLSSGGGYVAAQYTHEKQGLQSILTITFVTGIFISLSIMLTLYLFVTDIIKVSTDDQYLIHLTEKFIFITLPVIILFSLSSTIVIYLRICGHNNFVSLVSIGGVLLNIVATMLLIKVWKYGIIGAAIGTLLAASVEMILLVAFLKLKNISFLTYSPPSLKRIRLILCHAISSSAGAVIWSGGAFFFMSILGRSDPQALHAIAILMPLENIALMFTLGLSVVTSIEVGRAIPVAEKTTVNNLAMTSLALSFSVTLLLALLLFLGKNLLFFLFSGNSSNPLLSQLYSLMLVGVVLKSLSLQLIAGVLRAGGDTRFCLLLDFTMQWLILLPAAYLMMTATLSATCIYALIFLEEAVKLGFALHRFRSDRWRVNLTLAG